MPETISAETEPKAEEKITLTPEVDATKQAIAEERTRIFSILDLAENIDEAKNYIEKGLNPSDIAIELVRKLRKDQKQKDTVLPSPLGAMNLDNKARETLNLAKRYGV